MLDAQQRMFDALKERTLASLAAEVDEKVPAKFVSEKKKWFEDRDELRRTPARLRSQRIRKTS